MHGVEHADALVLIRFRSLYPHWRCSGDSVAGDWREKQRNLQLGPFLSECIFGNLYKYTDALKKYGGVRSQFAKFNRAKSIRNMKFLVFGKTDPENVEA